MIFVVYFMKMVRSLMTFAFDRKDELNMTVKEFVEGYTQLGSEQLKEKYVKDNLVRDYVPHLKKITYAKNVVESIFVKNGTGRFEYNSNILFLLYQRSIIEMYYDIQFDNNDNTGSQYDLLFEDNIISKLLEVIPESELKTYQFVFNNERDDIIYNNTDLGVKLNNLDDITHKIIEEIINKIDTEYDLKDKE